MPSITVENYLKQIYQEQPRTGLVPMGQLAAAVGVTAGTATSMMKALSEAGLVDYEPRSGVRLTEAGSRLALQVLRRHRLIELFLVQVLKLDWSQVHEEAEELEHAISDRVLQKMDELLGHPDTDPHGDPIPPATGKPRKLELCSLAECALEQPMRIARMMDQSPQFLKFANEHGLTPGAEVAVQARSESADAVTVWPTGGRKLTLGRSAAAKILVGEAEG
jgi:DtxR family Mn-dependent transcriptional regulator